MKSACTLAFLALALGCELRAQDTAYSRLDLRLSVLSNPASGGISEDWRSGTGIEAEVGTPLAFGKAALSVGHLAFEPKGGRPPFRMTAFGLTYSVPVLSWRTSELAAGVRLADMRMDFDDPAIDEGLRTEEEVFLGGTARAKVMLPRGFSASVDATYGVLMLGRRTPMAFITAGVGRRVVTPGWMRDVLR